MPSLDPELQRLSRQCWGSLELLHVLSYLSPPSVEAYAALGLKGRRGYFASRAAPLGAVDAALVEATFFVFAPGLVRKAMPSVWDVVTPEQITDVRYRTMGATLRSILPADAKVEPAVELVREACAGLSAPGRPLYAAHAGLGWPDDPVTALFHGSTLLREFRGDGHIAALLQAGLGAVEALVLDTFVSHNEDFSRATRGWSEEDWDDAKDRLIARGLVAEDGATLTSAGTALRADVELQTDRMAVAGWEHLGIEGCRSLRDLLAPMRAAVVDLGILPPFFAARGN